MQTSKNKNVTCDVEIMNSFWLDPWNVYSRSSWSLPQQPQGVWRLDIEGIQQCWEIKYKSGLFLDIGGIQQSWEVKYKSGLRSSFWKLGLVSTDLDLIPGWLCSDPRFGPEFDFCLISYKFLLLNFVEKGYPDWRKS